MDRRTKKSGRRSENEGERKRNSKLERETGEREREKLTKKIRRRDRDSKEQSNKIEKTTILDRRGTIRKTQKKKN